VSKQCNSRFWPWCKSKPVVNTVAVIAVVLIVARLALPYILKDYVNRQLNRSKDYSGRIGTVTVHLWRGAYRVHDVHIFKRTGNVPVPFFSSAVLDLSLDWNELFHRSIVSKIAMENPSLNFVSGPTKQQSQTGTENDWGKMLESLVPFEINRFTVDNGQIHFQNPFSNPPVDLYINELSVVATNFNNSRRIQQALPAGITANGTTLGSGHVYLEVHINPLAKTPAFELSGQLTNVDLTSLNAFLKAYGKFDVARGGFALFTSIAAENGHYEGYFKVLFKNLKVFNWNKDKKEDALEIFWKAIVGTLAATFKNHSHDELATKIPISGSFGATDVHYWPTIGSLLQNAFIKSLTPSVDETIKLEKVKQDEGTAPSQGGQPNQESTPKP